MRMLIKKLLKKHKYPPEGMDDAVQTVMLQCELWTDRLDINDFVVNNQYDEEENFMYAAETMAKYKAE